MSPNEEINEELIDAGSSALKESIPAYDLIKRPEVDYKFLNKHVDLDYSLEIIRQAEIEIKYDGYIKKAVKEAEKLLALEERRIPNNIDYDKIFNLALEAREKLKEIRPLTIGQASRISGVNPADIAILSVYIKGGMR